jgi:2-methylcitrate dehydratase PrpD
MTTIIDIHLKDGRVISGRADFGKGSPADPMSYEEVADKFRGCAEQARRPAQQSEAIIAAVRRLESLGDISEVMRLCTRA